MRLDHATQVSLHGIGDRKEDAAQTRPFRPRLARALTAMVQVGCVVSWSAPGIGGQPEGRRIVEGAPGAGRGTHSQGGTPTCGLEVRRGSEPWVGPWGWTGSPRSVALLPGADCTRTKPGWRGVTPNPTLSRDPHARATGEPASRSGFREGVRVVGDLPGAEGVVPTSFRPARAPLLAEARQPFGTPASHWLPQPLPTSRGHRPRRGCACAKRVREH